MLNSGGAGFFLPYSERIWIRIEDQQLPRSHQDTVAALQEGVAMEMGEGCTSCKHAVAAPLLRADSQRSPVRRRLQRGAGKHAKWPGATHRRPRSHGAISAPGTFFAVCVDAQSKNSRVFDYEARVRWHKNGANNLLLCKRSTHSRRSAWNICGPLGRIMPADSSPARRGLCLFEAALVTPGAKRGAKKLKRGEAIATRRALGDRLPSLEANDRHADQNPFEAGKSEKEAGLHPKEEPVEDFLLATQPQSFYPSSAIYPRPQTRAQRVVGPRRAALETAEAAREDGNLPLSSSPARLRPIPFQKVAPLRDDGFYPIQKRVMIKDHRRGGMAGYAGLEGPSFSFASLALTLETEFLEFRNDPARRGEARPSIAAAEKSLELLGRIAERPGPFQKVLLMICEELTESIFQSAKVQRNYEAASPVGGTEAHQHHLDSPSIAQKPKEVSAPYFWLYEQATAKMNKLLERLDEMEATTLDTHNSAEDSFLAFKSAEEGAGTSPQTSSLASSPSSPKSKKAQGPTAEEKMFEKLLDMQKEKIKAEDMMQEMALQTNSLEWELEAKGTEIEQLVTETTELKGSFLRMKADCLNLRADLGVVNKHNDRHFNQLQMAISRHEHERIVAEYESQLAAQEDKTSRLLSDALGEDGRKIDEMVKSMTPRPNWRRTGATKQILVDCSIFARTDTSAMSVDKLLQGYVKVQRELTEAQAKLTQYEETEEDPSSNNSSGWSGMTVTGSVITCMGIGNDVPAFLRYNGQVRNLKMRKGEAERHVRAVWAAKSEHDKQRRIMQDKPPSKLDEFIILYAKNKFNNHPKTMAEWLYNLVVSLGENSLDTDCDLFLKILMDELSEDVYHDELGEQEDAILLAQSVDRKENHGKILGTCSKEGFLHAIRDRFCKSFEETMELKKALDVVHGHKHTTFEYGDLFADDRDLSQNEFAEEFRNQSIRNRSTHAETLKKLVESARQADGDRQMDPKTFESALRMLDPTKTEQDFDTYMRRGANVGPRDKMPETMEPERFLHNLLTRGVVKPGTLGRLDAEGLNANSAKEGGEGCTLRERAQASSRAYFSCSRCGMPRRKV